MTWDVTCFGHVLLEASIGGWANKARKQTSSHVFTD